MKVKLLLILIIFWIVQADKIKTTYLLTEYLLLYSKKLAYCV